jgi:hypothetical protein
VSKILFSVAVYDGADLAGSVIERADSKFDTYAADGKRIGTFTTRLAASRAIPAPPVITTAITVNKETSMTPIMDLKKLHPLGGDLVGNTLRAPAGALDHTFISARTSQYPGDRRRGRG